MLCFQILDTLPIAQIHQNFMYIEKCPNINFADAVSDTKWIHAVYKGLVDNYHNHHLFSPLSTDHSRRIDPTEVGNSESSSSDFLIN